MYLWICGSFQSAKNKAVRKLQQQIAKKYLVRKSQIRNCGRFANIKKCSSQICGFAICQSSLKACLEEEKGRTQSNDSQSHSKV
jgi:hypothetical protein